MMMIDEKMEAAGELLEDFWFFDNLLHRKPRMLRSMSDPCTSSTSAASISPENLPYEETYASIAKLPPQARHCISPSSNMNMITRAPSQGQNQLASKASKGLRRAPSLPTSLQESPDFHDQDEVEFSMGKLIRQASMNYSDSLPPRQHDAKIWAPNQSLSIHRSTRKTDTQSTKLERQEDIRTNKLKTRNSFTEVEYEELQGFKHMGLEKNDRKLQDVMKMETKRIQLEDNGTSRRRPASLKGGGQSLGPPVPKSGENGKRSNLDMKAQIKFWARAVASNVRQEC